MSLGAAATWLAEYESPHPLSLLLVSLFELKAQFFYSVALNCFLLLFFFTFLDLSSVFFDCCLIHPVPKAGAGGGPLLCLLVFFSMGPGRSTGTTTRVGSCTPGDQPRPAQPAQTVAPSPTTLAYLAYMAVCSLHGLHTLLVSRPTPLSTPNPDPAQLEDLFRGLVVVLEGLIPT